MMRTLFGFNSFLDKKDVFSLLMTKTGKEKSNQLDLKGKKSKLLIDIKNLEPRGVFKIHPRYQRAQEVEHGVSLYDSIQKSIMCV